MKAEPRSSYCRTSSSMRKPLYPIEKGAQSATVCVTGGTGYIAGAIIARLLAAGHTVHATVRDPSNEQKLRWLRALPNASSHLKFFKVALCPRFCFCPALTSLCMAWPATCRLVLSCQDSNLMILDWEVLLYASQSLGSHSRVSLGLTTFAQPDAVE